MPAKKRNEIECKGNIAYIQLTQGKYAIVDAHIVPVLSRMRWFARHDRNILWYASTHAWNNNQQHMHRVIWEHLNGNIPDDMGIDHLNGNGLDNRVSNLRLANRNENMCNRKQRRLGLTVSKYPGVGYDRRVNKWSTKITIAGIHYALGYFDTEENAYHAYDNALTEYKEHGILPTPFKSKSHSKYRGVTFHNGSKKWQAQIVINKNHYALGTFDRELDAFNAYKNALTNWQNYGIVPVRKRGKKVS